MCVMGRFRFRLVALLLLVTLTCVVAGIGVGIWRAAANQRNVVSRLRDGVGGTWWAMVYFDDAYHAAAETLYDNGGFTSDGSYLIDYGSWDPQRQSSLWYNIVHSPVAVELTGALEQQSVDLLYELPHIRYLSFHADVAHLDLGNLGHLRDLRVLTLGGNATEEQIQMLANLPLKRLGVVLSGLTDDGLVHVGRIHGLHELQLTGTHVSDRGMAHLLSLEGFTRVRHLRLMHRRAMTDDEVIAISCMKSLESETFPFTMIHSSQIAEFEGASARS